MQNRLSAGLAAAVAATKTSSALAVGLGISRAAVAQWKCVPIRRVVDVEKLTGVSRHSLRPDVFGEHSAKGAS